MNEELKKEAHEKLEVVSPSWDDIDSFIDRATLAERANWKDICEKCRGKGYSTEISGTHGSEDFGGDGFDIPPRNHMVFCPCERGKQLESAIKKGESI